MAITLREKGYDVPCIGVYEKSNLYYALIGESVEPNDKYTDAPLYQQVIEWFDSKMIFINASHKQIKLENYPDGKLYVDDWDVHITQGDSSERFNFKYIKNMDGFTTKYAAIIAGIEEALKLI